MATPEPKPVSKELKFLSEVWVPTTPEEIERFKKMFGSLPTEPAEKERLDRIAESDLKERLFLKKIGAKDFEALVYYKPENWVILYDNKGRAIDVVPTGAPPPLRNVLEDTNLLETTVCATKLVMGLIFMTAGYLLIF